MWQKKGFIFNVAGDKAWNQSHAQVPVIDILDDRFRIYYSTRNASGQSLISYIEVNRENPKDIIYVHEQPILDFGKPGTFDDCGLMPTSIITVEEKKYLYYIGWTTKKSVPFHNSIGLAISYDCGKSFQKFSEGPIITTNHIEPYFSGTAFVMKDGVKYKMWYLSCIKWIEYKNLKEPIYHIKYAESEDGINWVQTGKIAIDLYNDEGGIASATVIKDGIYKMWYSYRKSIDYRNNKLNSYKIGYAESNDGIEWKRKDNLAGIDLSDSGWDSTMIAYPYVISFGLNKIMFYNGNSFGKTGFGYAIQDI
jgi:hypothetical protein